MKYLFFSIPSNVIPEKVYHLEGYNFIILASDRIETRFPTIETKSKLGLIYYRVEGDFQPEHVKEELRLFSSFFSLFHQGHLMFRWLLTLPDNFFNRINERVFETKMDILKLARSFHINKPGTLIYNFEEYPYPFRGEVTINFIELYGKYRSIERPSSLVDKIDLYSYAINKYREHNVYDNSNLEISLVYSIMEKFIKESIRDQREEKIILEGTTTITIMKDKGMGILIDEYVDKIISEPDSNEYLKELLRKLKKIRNTFYHGLRVLPDRISSRMAFEKRGEDHITRRDDLELGEGRLMGIQNLRMLLFSIIINELETHNNINND